MMDGRLWSIINWKKVWADTILNKLNNNSHI